MDKITKQPAETFSVGNDFYNELDSGETLVLSGLVNGVTTDSTAVAYDKNSNDVSSTILVDNTLAIVANDAGVQDVALQVKVRGGTLADKKYTLSLRAVTSEGNLYEGDIELTMRNK